MKKQHWFSPRTRNFSSTWVSKMDSLEQKKAVFRDLDRIILVVIGILFVLYLASGIFVVQANEKAVVFCFGKPVEVINPGIGYHWPWPIEWVKKVNVKQVQRVEAGFSPQGDLREELVPYCITGDRNIIHDRYVIQYRIAEPVNFLVRGAHVSEILVELTQATILETVAAKPVDLILTTGKSEMERSILEGLVRKLEELNLKIQIVGVERQSAEPPSMVKEAFQNVINAQEEMRTKTHEAENYRNQEIPKTKAEANQMRQEAETAKFERTSAAKGESERFIRLFREYKVAPNVTRRRLFIEMVEQVLPRAKVMVLATDKEGKPVRIRILQAPIPTSPELQGSR
jgi:membrane protease subunit HflK